jgi:hypothetical protein
LNDFVADKYMENFPGIWRPLKKAKSYFEVLRKIFSYAEVEKLSVPCSLIYHDESLYPAVDTFSYCICCAKAEVIHYGQAIPFNH